MKLGEIAKQLGCEVDGDAGLEISGVAGIEEAQPGELTFFVNRKYRAALDTTRASAVFVGEGCGTDADCDVAVGESLSRFRAGD